MLHKIHITCIPLGSFVFLFSKLHVAYADQSWVFSSGIAHQGEFCLLLACQLNVSLLACTGHCPSMQAPQDLLLMHVTPAVCRENKSCSPNNELCLRIAGSKSALQE